jgi:hypothetical protein
MATRTNKSALSATIKALRADAQLQPEDAALVRLAETLAVKLDDMIEGGEKAYSVALVGRLYFAVEEALRSRPEPPPPDSFAELLREMSTLIGPDGPARVIG